MRCLSHILLVFENMEPLTICRIFATVILAYAIWIIASGVRNLYFHPLASFPGPKLAAFSIWWKIYLEVFLGENLTDRLFELHGTYGEMTGTAPIRSTLKHVCRAIRWLNRRYRAHWS